MSEEETLSQLTLFAADSRARIYRWPESARAWLESGQDFGTSSIELLQSLSQDGLLSRTCPACYPATEDEILPSSFGGWSNAGMACAGGYLTLSISEWPSAADVCSLSDTLETEDDWLRRHPGKTAEDFRDYLRKYYLSPKAVRGILRRAEKRGKELPEQLQQALIQVATMEETPSEGC